VIALEHLIGSLDPDQTRVEGIVEEHGNAVHGYLAPRPVSEAETV
jgi:hypothetical protein